MLCFCSANSLPFGFNCPENLSCRDATIYMNEVADEKFVDRNNRDSVTLWVKKEL